MSLSRLKFNVAHQVGDRISFESLGFKCIYEHLSQKLDCKPRILDFAPADPNMIQFCGLCEGIYYSSADLFSSILISNDQRGRENPDVSFSDLIMRKLKSLNDRMNGRPLDVIVTWDLFNYLNRSNIIDMMALLSPMCREGSLLYSLIWLTDTMPSIPGGFSLASTSSVVYEFKGIDKIPTPRITAQSIISMMPSFKQNSLLASESGVLEAILEFDELTDPPDPNIIPSNLLTGVFR